MKRSQAKYNLLRFMLRQTSKYINTNSDTMEYRQAPGQGDVVLDNWFVERDKYLFNNNSRKESDFVFLKSLAAIFYRKKRFLMSCAYICCFHCFLLKRFCFSSHFRRLFMRGLVATVKFCSYFWRVTFAWGHEFLNVKRILVHACVFARTSKIRINILRKIFKDKN